MIGHENIAPRVQRYRDTDGWNRFINAKQFGGIRVEHQYSLVEAKTISFRPTF